MAKSIDTTSRGQAALGRRQAAVPRVSGFVTNGSEEAAASAIRAANLELEQQSSGHMSVPLVIALEQRDRALAELYQERREFEARRAADVAMLEVQVGENNNVLGQLRDQLREAERELAHLRDEPQTVIGVGHLSRMAMAGPGPHVPSEHQSLQSALEAARQDVRDANARVSEVEEARDAAVRELDEIRLEVYGKLESAQDEVIALQTHIDDLRRIFDEARDEWENENFRLKGEVDEIRQSLQEQLAVNARLRGVANGSAENDEGLAAPASDAAPSGAPNVIALQGPPVYRPHIPPAARAPAHNLTALAQVNASVLEPPGLAAEIEDLQQRSRGFGIGRLFQRK